MEPNCLFCNDSHKITRWKTYTKAWRVAREQIGHEWMSKVTVEELLNTCRGIRSGWKTTSGKVSHAEDCPVCAI